MPSTLEKTETNEATGKSDFFRCQISEECSAAQLRAGKRKLPTQVQESSIDGFTVLIKSKDARKLRIGDPWILEYDDSRLEVIGQWFFNSPGGTVQVGLRRLRDLTPEPVFKTPFWSRFSTSKTSESVTSPAVFGGFAIVLFLALALPGLGEQLGSANHIQEAVQWLCGELTGLFVRS